MILSLPHTKMFIRLFFVLLHLLTENGRAYMVANDPHHRIETLDRKGKYQLEWKVDMAQSRITFNVTVQTRGYVGFGLARRGKMTGADIVIGGLMPNGRTYFSDHFAVTNQVPEEDASQDWLLHEARETETYTFLSFSRDFDTCDPQDYPISEDKISMIWAYGERDNIVAYHHQDRGEYPVYLINPDYTPPLVRNFNTGDQKLNRENALVQTNLHVWTIQSRQPVPEVETTYWCTIHKGPRLLQKHHFIGFEVNFSDEGSRQRVHYVALSKCRAPEGRNATRMFSSYIYHRGQLCFDVRNPLGPIPTEYCTEMYQVWSQGGRPFFYPPHVGFPVGELPDEYFLLQVHYDNPYRLPHLLVDFTLDYYYTTQLRSHEGGIMVHGVESPGLTPSILIPPGTLSEVTYGICGKECTQKMFPTDGIRIFGLILHSHRTGVVLRFQQFRGNRELPWVASDDNFAFDYQQVRILNGERRVLPGDSLVMRCVYDNTKSNGTVVGGFSARQEMCVVFFFYYTKLNNYIFCSSEIESELKRQQILGIGNVTWSHKDVEFLVDAPGELAGLTVSHVSDNVLVWDADRREAVQKLQLKEPQVGRCSRELYSLPAAEGYRTLKSERAEKEENLTLSLVNYPSEARPYLPQKSCSFRDERDAL